MKTWIFLFMFFMISAMIIISNNNLALYKKENRSIFFQEYKYWLEKDVFRNALKATSYAIKMEWLPKK